mmetsp:Transcript_74063/g.163569  ORF Transcript_74063/g.163569 Transcript_74063/m.163569 type:complete len:244 (-) Transcript_74063:293-1024(-)
MFVQRNLHQLETTQVSPMQHACGRLVWHNGHHHALHWLGRSWLVATGTPRTVLIVPDTHGVADQNHGIDIVQVDSSNGLTTGNDHLATTSRLQALLCPFRRPQRRSIVDGFIAGQDLVPAIFCQAEVQLTQHKIQAVDALGCPSLLWCGCKHHQNSPSFLRQLCDGLRGHGHDLGKSEGVGHPAAMTKSCWPVGSTIPILPQVRLVCSLPMITARCTDQGQINASTEFQVPVGPSAHGCTCCH